jgi:hypothetical protein
MKVSYTGKKIEKKFKWAKLFGEQGLMHVQRNDDDFGKLLPDVATTSFCMQHFRKQSVNRLSHFWDNFGDLVM